MIKILFDNIEYFLVSSLIGTHNIDSGMALKQININCVITVSLKDFIVELRAKGFMLTQIFVKDKLFIEGFINEDNFSYRDSSGGTEIDLTINDRFSAIGNGGSDLIKTKPRGTMQSFLAEILKELNFDGKLYKNRYQRQIKTSNDFVKNGIGVGIQKIKSFERDDLVERDSASMLGEILSLNKLLLISNGYDTLTLEHLNSYESPIFFLVRNGEMRNISHGEKTNSSSSNLTPSKVIILNSNDNKDKNSAVVEFYNGGLPHIQKVKHVSLNASYQDIARSVNFSLTGIRARANSFLYKVPNVIFDANGEFFRPNRTVKVLDEKYGIDEDMTIMQVGFSIDSSNGTELTLNLTTKEAFDNNKGIKQKKALMRK